MKTALLKHYGKILLTILVLGAGAYFGFDTSKVVEVLKSEPAVVAPVTAPDAGQ